VAKHRIIDVYRGSTTESWLVVYDGGRIKWHIENDGPRFLRSGPESSEEWIDIGSVAKQLVSKVQAALIEMRQERESCDG
jgi:hypothetical protein